MQGFNPGKLYSDALLISSGFKAAGTISRAFSTDYYGQYRLFPPMNWRAIVRCPFRTKHHLPANELAGCQMSFQDLI